jgi:5-methylcytosine-specific restriction endonuclease McrA
VDKPPTYTQGCGQSVNKKVLFEIVKSENKKNVSGVAGYISNCYNCGDLIYIRFKVASLCVGCTAINLMVSSPKKFARFYRSGAWRRIRQVVFECKGRVCIYCQKRATHIDHATPICRGGTNDLSNLQPICGSCNSKKFKKTHSEHLSTKKKIFG